MYQRNSSTGFTLIEVMISLSISIFVISLVTIIYLAAQKNLSQQIAINTLLNNEKMAEKFFVNQIRLAGYLGCKKISLDNNFINHVAINISNQNIVGDATDINNQVSDGIRIWYASEVSTLLDKTMRGYSTFYLQNNFKIAKNDILVITNCSSTEIFQVKKISKMANNEVQITTQLPLNNLYSPSILDIESINY